VRGERHQKSEDLDARDVIKIQGDNFNTVLQFKMGCFSFFNIINKQQLKNSLNTNAKKHSTGEIWGRRLCYAVSFTGRKYG
jgi:hypothetical protein